MNTTASGPMRSGINGEQRTPEGSTIIMEIVLAGDGTNIAETVEKAHFAWGNSLPTSFYCEAKREV